MAESGIGARRACERLIEDGRVRVNGSIVRDLPIFVDSTDRIDVNGRPVLAPDRLLYVMLNKPARTLTTAADEPGADRRTVVDLVQHPSGHRLFPVGRLDYDTVGLILMTNDGALANRMTHPSYGLPKTYRATVRGTLHDEDVQKLQKGIYLAERKEGRTTGAARTEPVSIEVIRRARDRTLLEITLHEGRNRQVRRMLAEAGCPVKKLERIAMGPLRLKGLARGEWRELTRAELTVLRKAVPKKPKSKVSRKSKVSKKGQSRVRPRNS